MKLDELAFAISVLALIVAVLVFVLAKPAACNWCVPTICGTDAECLDGCHCAIPWGKATGECSG